MRAAESTLAPPPLPPAQGPMRLVSSLRYRDWRYLWSGLMASQTGEWMDNLAINWLVLVQTNSPLILGSVNLVRGLPVLVFGIAGGVVADRVNRRTLMICTHVGTMLTTAALAGLASADMLELWHIYLLLVLRGILHAFNQPARASLVGDLVPRSDIANAIALHSTIFNGTRMVGPAIAGFLVAAVGAPFVLWVHAASHLIAIAALFAMRIPTREKPEHPTTPLESLAEGITYVVRERDVLALMLIGIVPFILGQPYQSILPVFAKDVWQVGPEGLGLLTTAASIGSLTGSFGVSLVGDFRRKGLVMLVALIGFGAGIATFAISPSPVLAAALLVLTGACNQVYQTINTALLQIIVPSQYRGRVFGVHQMDRGFIPVGSFAAGALAEALTAPVGSSLMGGTLALFGIAALLTVPRMRRME